MSKSEITAIIEKARAAAQKHPSTQLTQAMTALTTGKYDEAIKLFTTIIGSSSETEKPKLSFNLAFAYYKQGKIDEMQASLQKAKSLGFDPSKITNILFCAGVELLNKEEFLSADEALATAEKAGELFKSIITKEACPVGFKIDVIARLHEAYERISNIKSTNKEAAQLSIVTLGDAAKSYEDDKDHTSPKLAFTIYKKLASIALATYFHAVKTNHKDNIEPQLKKALYCLQSAFTINSNDSELLNNLGVAKHQLAKLTADIKSRAALYKEAEETLATAISLGAKNHDSNTSHYNDSLIALESDLSLLGDV